MSFYCDFTCEKCGASGLFDIGDMNDLTRSDVEGVRCHNCKTCFAILEEDVYDEIDEYIAKRLWIEETIPWTS